MCLYSCVVWPPHTECVCNLVCRWSKKLITKASKTQFVDLPSVNVQFLRERGVVVRCSDFSVGALRKGGKTSPDGRLTSLPVLTSDKSTFNIPNDVHNPALQVGISLYFYPEKYGSKFLGEFPTAHMSCCLGNSRIFIPTCWCPWEFSMYIV